MRQPIAQPTAPEAPYHGPPIAFEANSGQIDPRVRFFARTPTYTMFLTRSGAVFSLSRPVRGGPDKSAVVRMRFDGADPDVRIAGRDRLPGTTNYLVGDADEWQRGIRSYARVRYQDIYPGIDLVFYERVGGGLESE